MVCGELFIPFEGPKYKLFLFYIKLTGQQWTSIYSVNISSIDYYTDILTCKARARDGARVYLGATVREAPVEHTLKR
jgi:hypothetical protein